MFITWHECHIKIESLSLQRNSNLWPPDTDLALRPLSFREPHCEMDHLFGSYVKPSSLNIRMRKYARLLVEQI